MAFDYMHLLNHFPAAFILNLQIEMTAVLIEIEGEAGIDLII